MPKDVWRKLKTRAAQQDTYVATILAALAEDYVSAAERDITEDEADYLYDSFSGDNIDPVGGRVSEKNGSLWAKVWVKLP
jgi:hypothetical protein